MNPFKRGALAGELDTIMSLLVNNDDLTRLVFYDDDNPLKQPVLTVAQKRSLINKKLVKRKNLDIISQTSGSFISVRLNHFAPDPDNPNAITHTADFYVVCHRGNIETKDGERDLLIVETLSKIFYLQNSVGNGKPKLRAIEDLVFNSNDFNGYLVSFIIQNDMLTQ